jgi:hypothetical protein
MEFNTERAKSSRSARACFAAVPAGKGGVASILYLVFSYLRLLLSEGIVTGAAEKWASGAGLAEKSLEARIGMSSSFDLFGQKLAVFDQKEWFSTLRLYFVLNPKCYRTGIYLFLGDLKLKMLPNGNFVLWEIIKLPYGNKC